MKTILRQWQTELGLVAFYDIQPGNWAGLFLQPQSLHRADVLSSRRQQQVNNDDDDDDDDDVVAVIIITVTNLSCQSLPAAATQYAPAVQTCQSDPPCPASLECTSPEITDACVNVILYMKTW